MLPEVLILYFNIVLFLPAALDPGVYSASNRNEYQKHTIFFRKTQFIAICNNTFSKKNIVSGE
jgi:hypothetical protein